MRRRRRIARAIRLWRRAIRLWRVAVALGHALSNLGRNYARAVVYSVRSAWEGP